MSRRRGPLATASLAVEAASVWCRQALVEPLLPRPSLPRAMHYIATHRCNARCIMCGIWKETADRAGELSPDALGRILGDRLFSRMAYVGVSGGEPFLRDDLIEICGVILDRCRRVKRLSLTTSGLHPRRMAQALPGIEARTRRDGVLLDVSVSVHGVGPALDRIYGVTGAFAKIERALELLERLRDEGRLSFSLNCVLLTDNLGGADELRRWAAGRGIPLSFVVGEHRARFRTDGLDSAFVDGSARQPLVEFLEGLADDPDQSTVAAGKYREIASMVAGHGARSLSCYYAMGGVLLGHDGRLYYCSHSREIGSCLDRAPLDIYRDPDNLAYRERELFAAECRQCPPYTRTRWEIERDLPRVLADSVRRTLGSSRRRP
jgi:MoaA/NifB/PqqE/SkfB family radical SAM enzyme